MDHIVSGLWRAVVVCSFNLISHGFGSSLVLEQGIDFNLSLIGFYRTFYLVTHVEFYLLKSFLNRPENITMMIMMLMMRFQHVDIKGSFLIFINKGMAKFSTI